MPGNCPFCQKTTDGSSGLVVTTPEGSYHLACGVDFLAAQKLVLARCDHTPRHESPWVCNRYVRQDLPL
jgi:hypothetical protein